MIDGFTNVLNGITGNVNGIVDASATDNTANRSVVVYTNGVKRKPLYEVFTGSTCPPCTPGNANFHSIVDTADASSFVQIKYQQDFPGTGDPYATNETVNRRGTYYAINSIPRMEINGEWDGNANSFTPAIHNEANTIPATFELNPTCYMDAVDSMFYVTLKYKALNTVTANQYKAYAVICESITKNNAKTNGETEFYYVVKKMIPDQNGTTLTTATLNVFDSLNVKYDLNGPYKLALDGTAANRINLATNHSIENFNNLYLVTWLQHTSTKIVVQANSSKITLKSKPTSITNVEIVNSFSIAPNPASNFATISLNSTKNGLMTFEVYNVVGEKMMNIDANVTTGTNKIDMNLQAIPNGNYIVKVLSNNTEIATEKFVVIK